MASRRYEGVLRPLTSTHWPGRVLCVDAVECETAEWSDTHGHVPDLLYWRAIPLIMARGKYDYCAMWEGDTEDDWWRRVHGICDRGQSLLVLCSRSTAVWAMLGVWSQLASAQLQLAPDGFAADRSLDWAIEQLSEASGTAEKHWSSGRLHDYVDRHTGYVCLSNPPAIARLLLRGTNCWITLVDVGNYGVSPPADTPRGDRVAQWIASWYTRYHAVCTEYMLGAWKPTVGGQAYEGWRHGYYHGGAIVCADQRVQSIESAAYIGGRCEAYQFGPIAGQVTYLDIRAAYCALCHTERVPVRVLSVNTGDAGAAAIPAMDWTGCSAKVRVRTDVPLYPYRLGGITVWPVGEFETVLCGQELALAVERGDIVAWRQIVQYHCVPILSQYAAVAYALRCQCESAGDREMTTVAKLLCNTIVGAMARRRKDWIPCARDGCDLKWGEWYGADECGELQRYRSLGGQVQREVDTGYTEGALPAIAAWITAACRVQLWRYVEIAGRENVYYVDTDALMCADAGVDLLREAGCVADGTLGMLGTRWVCGDVVVSGIKDYRWGNNVVRAGLPASRAEPLRDGDSYLYALSPAEQVRARAVPSGRVILRHYRRDAEYRHGVVHEDGSITPIVIGE